MSLCVFYLHFLFIQWIQNNTILFIIHIYVWFESYLAYPLWPYFNFIWNRYHHFSSAFVYLENCITYQMMLAIYLLFVADDDAIYCLFIYHFYCIYMLFALFFFVSNQNIFYSTFETPHKHQNNKAFNLNNKFTLMMMMFSQLFPPKLLILYIFIILNFHVILYNFFKTKFLFTCVCWIIYKTGLIREQSIYIIYLIFTPLDRLELSILISFYVQIE